MDGKEFAIRIAISSAYFHLLVIKDIVIYCFPSEVENKLILESLFQVLILSCWSGKQSAI